MGARVALFRGALGKRQAWTLALAAVIALAAGPPAQAGGLPTSVAGKAKRLGPGPAGASRPSDRRRAIPLRTRDPAAVAAAHRRAASPFGPVGGASSTPGSGPRPLSSVLLNQPGLSDANSTPPDTTGSIGPNSYIEVVNSKIAIYNRGTLASPPIASSSLEAFTADAESSPGDCDSQMQWDQQAQRFLYLSLDCNSSGDQELFMGWSKTADPANLTTDWCKFSFDTGTTLEDYPKLGHNDNYAIIGTNSFANGQTFAGSKLFFFDKPLNAASACPASLTVNSTTLPASSFTPEPVNLADASATGYVVSAAGASSGPASSIFLTQVTGNRGQTPTVTAGTTVNVSPFSIPPNIPQPGTGAVLDSLDARLTQAVGRSDPSVAGSPEAIWTQHTIDNGGRSQVRWYELIPGQSTPRQQGSIASSTDFAFNGAISPTRTGDAAAIFYNQGSSTNFVSLRSQSRTAAGPLGGMAGEVVLGTSSNADGDFSCSPCRWGDYAGASPDPSADDTIWGSSQLNGPATGGSQWVTRNFAVQTAPPNPLATTGAATGVGETTATLNGEIDPRGSATSYKFEYGTTSGYGSSTVVGDAGSGNGNVAESAALTGLTPNTTYHFRIDAIRNGAAVATGADATFQTPAPNPLASALPGPLGIAGVSSVPDTTAPSVTGYSLTHKVFQDGKAPTPITGVAARKPPTGTTFRYTLSEAATVKIVIGQGISGRRKGKRCVAPTKRLVKAKKCTRLIVKGTLTRTARTGANAVAFSGRIGSKALSPRGYQATLTATDSANNTSKPKTISFTIVKR